MDKPKDRAQRPTLDEKQVWHRNRQMKNWGSYRPLLFRKGTPAFLVSSYPHIFWVLIFYAYTLFSSRGSIAPWVSFLISLLAGIWLLLNDPGICSSSYPVLNEEQLAKQRGFCRECRIFAQGQIKHCRQCAVCIKGTYYHSKVFKMCIGKRNIKSFIGFLVSVVGHLIVCLGSLPQL